MDDASASYDEILAEVIKYALIKCHLSFYKYYELLQVDIEYFELNLHSQNVCVVFGRDNMNRFNVSENYILCIRSVSELIYFMLDLYISNRCFINDKLCIKINISIMKIYLYQKVQINHLH